MLPKKTIIKSKTATSSCIKNQNNGKSLSLIINTQNLSNSNTKKKLRQNNSNKVNYSNKSLRKKNNSTKNEKNIKTKIYNLTLNRQNSQSSIYSLKKKNINDIQKTYYNNNNIKHKKCYSYYLSDEKTPKIIELLNNQKKKKKNHLETYNNNNYIHCCNKSNSSLSLRQKKQNLSQGNLDNINFDDFQNYSIIKCTRNQKLLNKLLKENNIENKTNKTNKTKYNDRYDRNKCIIERRIYAGEKLNKKNIEKNEENKIMPLLGGYSYNKMVFNNTKKTLNKDTNLKYINKPEKLDTKKTNNNLHIKIKNEIKNNNNTSNKFLIKSRSNSNILNTSENFTDNNKIENTTNINNTGEDDGKEIKLIIINKSDLVNDSSQESTNQVGNSYSNKITLNNTNLGYKKEKFISSFLNGPEDIHYKFVELHKQRKIFYEDLCNKIRKDGESLENNQSRINNDFNIDEYSEYFENYNENVPII